jgi:hypothetical protein
MTTFASFPPFWAEGLNTHASKAHLAATRRSGDKGESWCGFVLDMTKPAPYAERCKLCLKKLADYTDQASQPVPELVTEVVTIQVTRPSASPDSATEYLSRVLVRKVSWAVAIVGQPESSES